MVFIKEKYLRENFEPIVKKSRSIVQVLKELKMGTTGASSHTVKKYILLYNLNIDHFYNKTDIYNLGIKAYIEGKRTPLHLLFSDGHNATNACLKNALYKYGFKNKRCEMCGNGEMWMGKKITLELDHIDGVRSNNNIENLRILCPNCCATLITHCRGKRKVENLLAKQELKKIQKQANNTDSNPVFRDKMLKRRLVKRPEYDLLKREISELGFVKTGKKYGVSDNAIRKWVKYFEKHGF